MTIRALLMTLTVLNIGLISGVSMAGTTQQFQSHESILSAVRNFLQKHSELEQHNKIDIQLGHIDPRLKVSQCAEALQLSLAPGSNTSGKTTVNVRCSAKKPWALYVTAMINKFEKVYQTSAALARGHIITQQDIQIVEYNLSKLNRGYYTDKKDLIGQETSRRLNKFKVIHPGQVKAPLMVKQGEQVALVATNKQFSVRMSGKALMNGALGDHIRVKNLSSKRIIEGKVTRSGEVTVIN